MWRARVACGVCFSFGSWMLPPVLCIWVPATTMTVYVRRVNILHMNIQQTSLNGPQKARVERHISAPSSKQNLEVIEVLHKHRFEEWEENLVESEVKISFNDIFISQFAHGAQ
jgi:hypothetical protein